MADTLKNDFTDQISRIKSKLSQARKIDSEYKVFGAESHNYFLAEPVDIESLLSFEQKYSVTLPCCYRSFLLQVGNGGKSYQKSGAGPFYGIYPLGSHVDELIENPEHFLKKEPFISPQMLKSDWDAAVEDLCDDEIADADYELGLAKIFGGILPIGSQGCTYLHALIISGENSGRVVNINLDLDFPKITFEKNFLDWYERWLDEVNSGLLFESPSWFGYTMGGDDEYLLKEFDLAESDEIRLEALNGLFKLNSLKGDNAKRLLKIINGKYSTVIQHTAVLLLSKFYYEESIPVLKKLFRGDESDCLICCKSIFLYAKEKSEDWVDTIIVQLEKGVDDAELFSFITYILKESGIDYGKHLLPYCGHESEEIRISSYYSLGLLKNKRNYIDQFVIGLNDQSSLVVHSVLQALSWVKDKSLMTHYMKIIERFESDENYVLTNLNHRLKEYGFSGRSDFARKFRRAGYDPDKIKFGFFETVKSYLKIE